MDSKTSYTTVHIHYALNNISIAYQYWQQHTIPFPAIFTFRELNHVTPTHTCTC